MNSSALDGVGHLPVIVVGTGFAGIGAAVRLQERGIKFAILERSHDFGGTWRDNTYPGCRCDVPSHLYSFSFAPNPEWSETYSPQPEIHAYLQSVAKRYGLERFVHFGTTVERVEFDEVNQHWRVFTDRGLFTAGVLLVGNGPLAEPSVPSLPGIESFTGTVMHSARWDHDVELDGKRVAVIGTGASAIQIVPSIQKSVAQLDLYQRTAAWVMPHNNREISDRERELYRKYPILQKAMRVGIYLGREWMAILFTKKPSWSKYLHRIGLRHLERSVKDPVKRAKLTPNFDPGCKRLMPSNRYLRAVDADNVDLVTAAIAEVTPTGIRTADGVEHPTDVIVYATGFKVTDNPIAEMVRGRGGVTLAEYWKDTGIQAHWGLSVPDFPNLFMLAGPNTGIGHTSLIVMIEAQLRYIMKGLDAMRRRRATTLEVRPAAYQAYNDELARKMKSTIWSTGGCKSWYQDERGHNPTLWPDFTWKFVLGTRQFDEANWVFDRPVPVVAPQPQIAEPTGAE